MKIKWREASGVLRNQIIPKKLKGKFDKSVVKRTLLNGSECLMIDKKIEQKKSVVEMKMLKPMSEVSREDR